MAGTLFLLVPANNASELCILKAENSHDYTNSISNRGVTQNLYSIFGNGFESENVMLFRPTLTVGKQFFFIYSLGYGGNTFFVGPC